MDNHTSDDPAVPEILSQIEPEVDQFLGDGAYDKNPVYNHMSSHSPNATITIPPRKDAVLSPHNHTERELNIAECQAHGRMHWQHLNGYGRRSNGELAIQRYTRIVGEKMHARKPDNQKKEGLLGCSVLNKMTSLGMPDSYRHV